MVPPILHKGVEGEMLCPRVWQSRQLCCKACQWLGTMYSPALLDQQDLRDPPEPVGMPSPLHNILGGQVGSLDLNPHNASLRKLTYECQLCRQAN